MFTKEERTANKQIELKTENSALERELADERTERQQLIDLLRDAVSASPTTVKVRSKRGGRLLWAMLIGATAYTLGARAGSERYAAIASWVRKVVPATASKDSLTSPALSVAKGESP